MKPVFVENNIFLLDLPHPSLTVRIAFGTLIYKYCRNIRFYPVLKYDTSVYTYIIVTSALLFTKGIFLEQFSIVTRK